MSFNLNKFDLKIKKLKTTLHFKIFIILVQEIDIQIYPYMHMRIILRIIFTNKKVSIQSTKHLVSENTSRYVHNINNWMDGFKNMLWKMLNFIFQRKT